MLKAVSQFISNDLNKPITIKKVISGKKSESTNSFYYLFLLNNDKVIGFSISDHFAKNHYLEVLDNLTLDDDFAEVLYELDDVTTNTLNDCPSGILDEDSFYQIDVAKKYQPTNLANHSSLDRALAGLNCEITASQLLNNNQVLKVVYNQAETEFYINYSPVDNLADNHDVAIAIAITNHFKDARKIYYNNVLSAYSQKEVNSNKNIKDNLFDEDGDLFDDVDAIKIFNQTYYVNGFELIERS